jgi:hypothetical protein
MGSKKTTNAESLIIMVALCLTGRLAAVKRLVHGLTGDDKDDGTKCTEIMERVMADVHPFTVYDIYADACPAHGLKSRAVTQQLSHALSGVGGGDDLAHCLVAGALRLGTADKANTVKVSPAMNVAEGAPEGVTDEIGGPVLACSLSHFFRWPRDLPSHDEVALCRVWRGCKHDYVCGLWPTVVANGGEGRRWWGRRHRVRKGRYWWRRRRRRQQR